MGLFDVIFNIGRKSLCNFSELRDFYTCIAHSQPYDPEAICTLSLILSVWVCTLQSYTTFDMVDISTLNCSRGIDSSEILEKTGTMQEALRHQRTTVREDLNC